MSTRLAGEEISHRTFGAILGWLAWEKPRLLNQVFHGIDIPPSRLHDSPLPKTLEGFVTNSQAIKLVGHYMGSPEGWGLIEDERTILRNLQALTGNPLAPFLVGRNAKTAGEYNVQRALLGGLFGGRPDIAFEVGAEKMSASLNSVFDTRCLSKAGWAKRLLGERGFAEFELEYKEGFLPDIVGDLYSMGTMVATIEWAMRENVRLIQHVSPFSEKEEGVKDGLNGIGVGYDRSSCEYDDGGRYHKFRIEWDPPKFSLMGSAARRIHLFTGEYLQRDSASMATQQGRLLEEMAGTIEDQAERLTDKDREVLEGKVDAANARADAAVAIAKADRLEEANARSRKFNRRILGYANQLIGAAGKGDRHGKQNKLLKITLHTSDLVNRALGSFYDNIETVREDSASAAEELSVLERDFLPLITPCEEMLEDGAPVDINQACAILYNEKRDALTARVCRGEELTQFIRALNRGRGARLNLSTRKNFTSSLGQLCRIWHPKHDRGVMGSESWEHRWSQLHATKGFQAEGASSETMLPLDTYRVEVIDAWYNGIRKSFPDLEDALDHDSLLGAFKTRLLNRCSVARISMEMQKEGRDTKEFGFFDMDLKTIADSAVEVAQTDKGRNVQYTSNYSGLEPDDVTVQGIPFIMADVVRDLFYNCIDAGSETIDVQFGRISDLESVFDENATLTLPQKRLLQAEGEFYVRIRDTAGKGKLPLTGPSGAEHKGARPMTQYLMTGELPGSFTTKDGAGGEGTVQLYEMLDFMTAHAFYDLTDVGTDMYVVFTGRELYREDQAA